MKENIGERVNKGLRQINIWTDEFILEIVKPLAMLGLVMGTVDLFLRGGMVNSPWFTVPWAVVQAVSIDGLFFAVWFKVFAGGWARGVRLRKIGLVLIGAVLSVVVGVTNSIISLQQLWNLADSQDAMTRLGIGPVQFTVVRAILMVAVLVMLAFTYWQKATTKPPRSESGAPQSNAVAPYENHGGLVDTMNAPRLEDGAPQEDRGGTVVIEEAPRLELAPPPDRRNDAMVLLLGGMNTALVARETGIAPSTIRRWKEQACPINAVVTEEMNDV